MRRRDLLIRGSILAGASALKLPALGFHHLFSSKSLPLRTISVGTPAPVPNNSGDTWVTTWANDGNLYSPSNDTEGFSKAAKSNIAFNRIDGTDPLHLSGITVNPMHDYGKEGEKGPDHCTWKSSGCIAVDGVLYWVVARHCYGEDSGDPYRRQTAQNASIIKSTDFGKTWTRSAQANYDSPMFPGRRFATPYFLENGRDPNRDKYIYALSNNGFWDCGDDVVLGRVSRSKISQLNANDWEFYAGGDGSHSAAWTHNSDDAKPLLTGDRKFGMNGATYLPHQQRYLMIGWYYPAGGGKIKGAQTHTAWDFYESPQPWGPWTRIGSYDSSPSGYYSPQVCPKFQEPGKVFVCTAGNWGSPKDYRLTVFPFEIGT